jgi:hypothetical protein
VLIILLLVFALCCGGVNLCTAVQKHASNEGCGQGGGTCIFVVGFIVREGLLESGGRFGMLRPQQPRTLLLALCLLH